ACQGWQGCRSRHFRTRQAGGIDRDVLSLQEGLVRSIEPGSTGIPEARNPVRGVSREEGTPRLPGVLRRLFPIGDDREHGCGRCIGDRNTLLLRQFLLHVFCAFVSSMAHGQLSAYPDVSGAVLRDVHIRWHAERMTSVRVLLFANTEWYLFNFRLSLLSALRAAGHEVVLVSPPGAYASRLRELGFRWIGVPMRRRSLNPFRELYLFYR